MYDDDYTAVGEHYGYGRQAPGPFGLLRCDRRQHVYTLGKTGVGKSALLESMAIQDIQRGDSVVFIDLRGQSAQKLLDYVPPERVDDVCYFAPFDLAHPIGLNLLAGHTPETRHLAASAVLSACSGVWKLSFTETPQIVYILTNTIAALMETPGAHLLMVKRLLLDKAFRTRFAAHLSDPVLRTYWLNEFSMRGKSDLVKAVTPILTRIGELSVVPMMRNIFGQAESGFDPRRLMNERGILIANLDKGKLGEENANLISSFLVSAFVLAAGSRVEPLRETAVQLGLSEEEVAALSSDELQMLEPHMLARLPDCYLYVDGFENVKTEAFASALAEMRKYRLCFTLANQFEEQLSPTIRAAVFGTVGTIIAFRVGRDDAEHLSREFGDEIAPKQFTDLSNHEIAVHTLTQGENQIPFLGQTILPQAPEYGLRSKIIERSRAQFAKPRETVERELAPFLSPPAPAPRVLAPSSLTRKKAAQKVRAAQQEIQSEIERRITARAAPVPLPHSSTASRADHAFGASPASSPESGLPPALRRFRRRFVRRFASLLPRPVLQ